MPRQPRYNLIGVPQHVIQRGNNRSAVFFSKADCRRYLDDLRRAAERHDCQVHAYVLMTNHVHLLMTPRVAGGVSKAMQSLGRRYVAHINGTYQRTGTLWEGRYKAALVESERYLLTCHRYIEMNPVRARGMDVSHPGEYPWSSYRANALGAADPLVTPHPEYLKLGANPGERERAYRRLFEEHIDEQTLTSIRRSLNECRVFGGEAFKDEIEAVLARRVRPGKRGRPPKAKGEGTSQGVMPL